MIEYGKEKWYLQLVTPTIWLGYAATVELYRSCDIYAKDCAEAEIPEPFLHNYGTALYDSLNN
jgi:hypothetical protein